MAELFSSSPIFDWNARPLPVPHGDTPLFTEAELVTAALRLPSGKAPGLRDIPNEALAVLCAKRPDVPLAVFNGCLAAGTFPDVWRTARLVLLHKEAEMPMTIASSFRPLCMLNSAGKLLERLILRSLSTFVAETGGLTSTSSSSDPVWALQMPSGW